MPRRDETFIIYYREDYEEYLTDNPSALVCLSQSTVELCLSALRFADWPTRWRISRDDHNPRVTGDIWEEVQQWGELAQKELIEDMSCDISAALEAITTAINNSNSALAGIEGAISGMSIAQTNTQTVNCECGCGGGGGGTTIVLRPPASTIPGVVGSIDQGSGETIPIYGTNPPLGVEPGQFPEGYESEEEYLLDKCQIANLMVDGFVQTLRNLGALGVFNFVALTGLIILAIAGIIIFPPAFVPIAAAALGVLSVNVTILAVVANEIEANRSEWVCTLYNSDSTDAAIEAIADLLDIIISSLEVTGPVGLAIKTICLVLVNGETLNQLFTKTAHILYPDADCSGCAEELSPWHVLTQFDPSVYEDFTDFGVDTVFTGIPDGSGKYTVYMYADDYYNGQVGVSGQEVEIVSISGLTGQLNVGQIVPIDNCLGYPNTEPPYADPPLTIYPGVQRLDIYSTTPFTMTLRLEGAKVTECV